MNDWIKHLESEGWILCPGEDPDFNTWEANPLGRVYSTALRRAEWIEGPGGVQVSLHYLPRDAPEITMSLLAGQYCFRECNESRSIRNLTGTTLLENIVQALRGFLQNRSVKWHLRTYAYGSHAYLSSVNFEEKTDEIEAAAHEISAVLQRYGLVSTSPLTVCKVQS